jgi:hypothetical protein
MHTGKMFDGYNTGYKSRWFIFAVFLWGFATYLDAFSQSQDSLRASVSNPQDLIANQPTVRPSIYFNHYATPQRRHVSKKKEYTFAQDNIGFFVPVYTSSWFKRDSVSIASLHVLAVADFVSYRPQVTFAYESFRVARFSMGGRMFYSDGHKSILYIGLNPFTSKDLRGRNQNLTSMTGAIIYSRTVSRTFAYRLGVSNSYTFGVLLPLPVAGIRIGALDQVHLSIQFPKNVAFNIPVGKKTMFSIFAKSMGGLYNISMQDTFLSAATTHRVRLARYELTQGGQINVRLSNHFSFYVGTGLSTRRRVNFSYRNVDTKNWEFSRHRIPPALFLSFGLCIRLGRTKQVYNDAQMYNLFELNTINGVGQKDTGTNDNDIPANFEKYKIENINKVKYKDVEDLITDEY